MDLEYDTKFEEMKKYIPFLENMIKRLESTTSASANPRQAQLDKIRSLRDLLLDKKKRMKMENLLKCEQVLVNLYAKVEQRDSLSSVMKVKEDSVFSIDSPTPKEKSELEAVRNKLKTVAKIQDETQETLPEIARASEVQEVCTSGSKEPALFQRRPNNSLLSPSSHSPNKNIDDTTKISGASAKRNYTRVLVSPERSSRRWSPAGNPEEKPLYSRRSPHRSPRRFSPSYHKRERKKSTKESYSRKSKGINITLNVPEESLNSLNTRDILPRIINCKDGDVDIDTLRELRKQILGELKKTGANDDISDLILKSYNKRDKTKKKDEVEEGELSDSESEAIESIYGSLVVKEQNAAGHPKNFSDKNNRKIQICLVINSDQDQSVMSSVDKTTKTNKTIDASEFEMYDKAEATEKVKNSEVIIINDDDIKTTGISLCDSEVKNKDTDIKVTENAQSVNKNIRAKKLDVESQPTDFQCDSDNLISQNCQEKKGDISPTDSVKINNSELCKDTKGTSEILSEDTVTAKSTDTKKVEVPLNETVQFKANFYKPLVESETIEQDGLTSQKNMNNTKPTPQEPNAISEEPPKNKSGVEDNLKEIEGSVEIPLLNEPTVAQKPATSTVSEIDILQALKNEILSETISLPTPENSATPLLHQPKIVKVASVQEILPKKRISIEKYKEKSVKPAKLYLFSNESDISSKDEHARKSKIKLTEKECERFNIPKMDFDEDDSSNDNTVDKDNFSMDDIYGDLAPKSPDRDESSNIESTPPVIIPADPVKAVSVTPKVDIDMRTLPVASPTGNLFGKAILPTSTKTSFEVTNNDTKLDQNRSLNEYRPPLVDPRIRREQNMSIQSPSPHATNVDRTLRPTISSSTPSAAPNMTPIMTPNARSYEMTPSHAFDLEQSNHKHVYAPAFSISELPDLKEPRGRPWEEPDSKVEHRGYDDNRDLSRKWDDPRSNSVQRDIPQNTRYNDSFGKYSKGPKNDRFDKREDRSFTRADCPLTPLPSFGRSDTPITSPQAFVPLNQHPPFVHGDCPATPSHPFGRLDCPSTPNHSFGRSDCSPTTLIGRSECPVTPSHTFGRSDCPPTPNHPTTPIHPFGRSGGPPTSNHKFNRLECSTPVHPFGTIEGSQTFGRSECPMTPSNPFGMSECPKTPIHQFGRSNERTNGPPFGRDFKFTKDPRLYRQAEYETSPRYDENERDYYKNRGNSNTSQKPGSYRSYEREHSVNRGDKNKYLADKGGRYFSREQSRYEQGRSASKDYESDRYSKDKRSQYDEQSYELVGSRRYQPEKGFGKNVRPDGNYRSTSRAPSVGRTPPRVPDTRLSVKPDAGRSFTIDTSINTTFQNIIESGKGIQVFDYSFDSRRKRASSVGRSLVRESSVGRTTSQCFKSVNDDNESKKRMFRRASSVGRELAVGKSERSFQEIKADFETYRSKSQQLKSDDIKFDLKSKDTTELNRYRRSNLEKRENDFKNSSNTAYSPRKNYRDPRMRKNDNRDQRKRVDEKIASRDPRRRTGIDYSNDNIAKGTILGSGCGVKNYKIPKIKRPVEDKVEETDKKVLEKDDNKDTVKRVEREKIKEIGEGNAKDKGKDKIKEVINKEKEGDNARNVGGVEKVKESKKAKTTRSEMQTEQEQQNIDGASKIKASAKLEFSVDSNDSVTYKSDENIERRVTRSSTKGMLELNLEDSPVKAHTRKYKKSVLRDSDSEDFESDFELNKDKNISSKINKTSSPIKSKKANDDLDSTFGMDDLEMFADNAVSDPVIDNINALIADLDNDIDTTKNDTGNDFTNEITLENMLESITSPERNNISTADKSGIKGSDTNTITEGQESSLTESKQKQDDNVPPKHITDGAKDIISTNIVTENNIAVTAPILNQGYAGLKEHDQTESSIVQHDVNNQTNLEQHETHIEDTPVLCESINEDTVSTTHIETEQAQHQSKLNETDLDRVSTPDSTINTDDFADKAINEDGLPDSTNEMNNETNVTSTETVSKTVEESSSSHKQMTSPFDSIGSLLSLLQDKTKIKEVLSMLGGQSNENDKIKKKLEKLSEIMSEEEDIDTEDKEGNEVPEINKHDNTLNTTETSILNTDETVTNIDEVKIPIIDTSSASKIDESSNVTEVSVLPELLNDNATEKHEEVVRQNSGDEENQNEGLSDKEDSTDTNEITDNKNDSLNDSRDNIEAPDTDKEADDVQSKEIRKPKKKFTKRSKYAKKNKGKQSAKKGALNQPKRATRAGINIPAIPKIKKPSRELLMLQEDIKEMFIRDEILSSTGIRMCRLAKLTNEKNIQKENTVSSENEPVVVLEKFKDIIERKDDISNQEKVKKKKPGPKPKAKWNDTSLEADKADITMASPKYKPGPKSKTKPTKKDRDPYAFETDSVENSTEKASDDDVDTDSDTGSVVSSKSFGSTECLADIKKKSRRKRRGWQAGVIKPKHKKKKVETKVCTPSPNITEAIIKEFNLVKNSNKDCFTDRTYCFRKNVTTYNCRMCSYVGTKIVNHYKKEHPHIEIPLSRMAPLPAKEAIEQCNEINFQAISKIPSDKYVCIFCCQEFGKRSKSPLESFFWHIVSMHTGEYKQDCTQCQSADQCPSELYIPSLPDGEGQLIGYICTKCNFTQISLENLKNHVILRHNDEKTTVCTINLSAMSRKALKALLRHCNAPEPRALRSCRSNQSLTEASDDYSDVTESSSRYGETESADQEIREIESLPEVKPSPIQSKITFETDDNVAEPLDSVNGNVVSVKSELPETENEPENADESEEARPSDTSEVSDHPQNVLDEHQNEVSDDIVDYPHFKISFSETGAKEYICCINRHDKHFKTTLLISMKKHVQMKHREIWDGYCYMCKVIVTAQGAHQFKDCLQHYLDKHMDSFPVLESDVVPTDSTEILPILEPLVDPVLEPGESSAIKPIINVRPLRELISKSDQSNFPKIESVVSLGVSMIEPPRPSPTYPTLRTDKPQIEKQYKYEETQAEVMSKKHRVVLDTMMSRDKLIKVYKCAGRFCSFTTDSAEEALLHASTHQRIGGIDALNCSYCDFDTSRNAIDLVMHVFKTHGSCQYSCGQCFYRAAASQLVGAHMTRMHPSTATEAVLRTTIATAPASEANMLTREEAVQYYVCGHSEQFEKCKFRTYTPDKFSEHLQQRHSTAMSHPCNFCSKEEATPSDLVIHMKTHGLKLYQCTWCVHGADKEGELLAHVSAAHPSKQPQAYLRIITNKDGSNELRVLPLAFLNKSKILTEDVIPSGANENPVREAERSIELEKLIGHANLLIEANQSTEPNTSNDETPLSDVSAPIDEPIHSSDINIPEIQLDAVVPPHVTPPRTESPHDISLQKTPILKMEPVEAPNENRSNEVVVLDSDEEDSRQGVIELSDDDPSTSTSLSTESLNNNRVVPTNVLHRCPKCKILCKTIHGLKKHLVPCLSRSTQVLICPHCSLKLADQKELLSHYVHDHRNNNYSCEECGANFLNLTMAKNHMKKNHDVSELMVTSKIEKGIAHFTVRTAIHRAQPKRKLSGNATEAPVPKRRYCPQEVDQLPINPILDQLVYCSICEFSTKVRLNMVRHLQLHAEQQPVPQTAPVNPVPHLETNEKHFDKMVNLASSSIVTRAPDKSSRPDVEPTVTVLIPPEAAARYPKYVPERQRLTCGAKGCSYISVDEHMLRCHWETLHSGTNDYHCVHCPPYQHLDTSKPLTASRILAHLKMHDVALYACSMCSYYHYKREALDKHLSEIHKNGKLMVVREEGSSAAAVATASQPPAAPTMDLKPWQCGLCKFKSMLRPEVVEHCSKRHQSKMQYKCAYCPFRTSAIENITKHQANSHSGKAEDVFYYYYREGSVPDEKDGTSCWQKQRQKAGITETEIKTEAEASPPPSPATNPANTATDSALNNTSDSTPSVDLSLVKTEATEVASGVELDVEELCKKYGAFSDPNGLHFTCSLCKVVAEETREAMQCHLYEELKYRKWGCGLCSYKAFHKNGLNEHMSSEHRRQYNEPIELPTDLHMEKWVAAQLNHQEAIIARNKENFVKLKQAIVRNSPGPSNAKTQPEPPVTDAEKYTLKQLEEAFGSFGTVDMANMMFSCPKCPFTCKDEVAMKDHLESELSRIRWCCTKCSGTFQTYHEAQFHAKSHIGEAARPKEAIRDPAMRSTWVATALQTQKQVIKAIQCSTAEEPIATEKPSSENENSLLVVRYEERVSTPEDTLPVRRKRSAPDSDDEEFVIDAPSNKKTERSCPYCDFKTKYSTTLRYHTTKHFNLRPYTCTYCDFSSYRQGVVNHIEKAHPGLQPRVKHTEIPPEMINNYQTRKPPEDEPPKLICLICEKSIPESETDAHVHENTKPSFAKKGDVVVKCCICLVLRIDVKSLQEHHNSSHPDIPINYALFKLLHNTRETNYCGYCNKGFKYLRDLKSHHNAVHSSFQLMYTSSPYVRQETEGEKKSEDVPFKKCARKSTTKLPMYHPVAKKSTTKLPSSTTEEFSYYNTKPASLEEYANVTTYMPFCNTMMPFSLKKLSEIIKIEPKVYVTDITSERNDSSDD